MDLKKFNKFLNKYTLKGVLKICKTYEEADFVMAYDKVDYNNTTFITKKNYEECDKSCIADNFIICFVKHTNPRNKKSLEVKLTKLESLLFNRK